MESNVAGSRAEESPGPNLLVIAAITAALLAISAVGGLATDTDSDWYRSLNRPDWQPPSWVFGPVWTAIYILLGVSAYLTWRGLDGSRRRAAMALYALNGLLNVGWTLIFFQLEAATLAGVEIVALLVTILLLIGMTRREVPLAAAALVPYGLWVGFATALTWTIALSN